MYVDSMDVGKGVGVVGCCWNQTIGAVEAECNSGKGGTTQSRDEEDEANESAAADCGHGKRCDIDQGVSADKRVLHN